MGINRLLYNLFQTLLWLVLPPRHYMWDQLVLYPPILFKDPFLEWLWIIANKGLMMHIFVEYIVAHFFRFWWKERAEMENNTRKYSSWERECPKGCIKNQVRRGWPRKYWNLCLWGRQSKKVKKKHPQTYSSSLWSLYLKGVQNKCCATKELGLKASVRTLRIWVQVQRLPTKRYSQAS